MTQNRRRKAATTTVYNSTDGPLPYDDEGRIIPARESLPVESADVEPIKGHVDAGRFIVTSDPETDDGDVDPAPHQSEE